MLSSCQGKQSEKEFAAMKISNIALEYIMDILQGRETFAHFKLGVVVLVQYYKVRVRQLWKGIGPSNSITEL